VEDVAVGETQEYLSQLCLWVQQVVGGVGGVGVLGCGLDTARTGVMERFHLKSCSNDRNSQLTLELSSITAPK